jgi:hypothetical protein
LRSQPPGDAGANADCHIGAAGVNFHAAEVRRCFAVREGGAYYNPVAYGARGAGDYALLLFARFAQGEPGLRPLPLPGDRAPEAWQLRGGRRIFLINRPARRVRVSLAAPGPAYALDA